MKRRILLHPDPRLRKACEPVGDLSDSLLSLADDMLETMYGAPGLGLAAPQVGVLKRVIVLDCAKEPEESRPIAMFNPEITASSEDTAASEEGCLSIPGHYAEIERPCEVEVRWTDRSGAACSETFAGLWAVCVQHEIDHLDGKLFIDMLSPMKRQMITRKMRKMKREAAKD